MVGLSEKSIPGSQSHSHRMTNACHFTRTSGFIIPIVLLFKSTTKACTQIVSVINNRLEILILFSLSNSFSASHALNLSPWIRQCEYRILYLAIRTLGLLKVTLSHWNFRCLMPSHTEHSCQYERLVVSTLQGHDTKPEIRK